MRRLRLAGQLPSDIFTIQLDSLRITGIGAEDMLNQDHLDLKSLLISHPVITVDHTGSGRAPGGSLNDRLSGLMKSFHLAELRVSDGELITKKPGGKSTRLPGIDITMTDILIDSTTKNDHSRFLFAKKARLSLRDFAFASTDGVYNYRIGKLEVNAEESELTATSISIRPRYSKGAWMKAMKTRKERFELAVPSARLDGVDWWLLVQDQRVFASSVVLRSPTVSIYLNRYAPEGGARAAGFPHQMLMRMPMKIDLQNVKISNGSIDYEEVNPLSGQSGTLILRGLNGTVTNVTNQKEAIAKNGWTRVRATASVMNKIHAQLGFDFDLRNYKSGNFSSTIAMGSFDGDVVNPVTEPLGMFHIKRGNVSSLSSKVSGNSMGASGDVQMLYQSLHITPLEKDRKHPGNIREAELYQFSSKCIVAEGRESDARQSSAHGSSICQTKPQIKLHESGLENNLHGHTEDYWRTGETGEPIRSSSSAFGHQFKIIRFGFPASCFCFIKLFRFCFVTCFQSTHSPCGLPIPDFSSFFFLISGSSAFAQYKVKGTVFRQLKALSHRIRYCSKYQWKNHDDRYSGPLRNQRRRKRLYLVFFPRQTDSKVCRA